MKKKLALILAGTAMAAMVLAGCGEKNNASGEDAKTAERIEGLTIAIFYLYAPLFYSLLFPIVPLLCRFTASETAWTWLSFSLHENAQKIKPANGFFTEMTYLERSVHLRSKLPQSPEKPS